MTRQENGFLTDFEKITVIDLSAKNYNLLYSYSSGINQAQVKLYDQKITQARKDLDNLSKIQLEKGKKINQ